MKPATPAPSVEPGRSVDEPSDHSLRAGPWGAGLALQILRFRWILDDFFVFSAGIRRLRLRRSAGQPSPELKCARTPDLDHVFRDEHANLRMTVETVAGTSCRPNRPREPPELVPKAADVDVDGSVDRRSAIPPNVA